MPFPRSVAPFRILSILATLIALLAVSMGAHLWHRSETKTNSSAQANPSSTLTRGTETAAEQGSQPQIVALPILLKFAGFVPAEITKPAGDYFFSVGNQSGVSEIVLRLAREHGEKLHAVQVKRQRLRWRQAVHLTPGNYLLTEANHPLWVCRITITPN